MNILHNLYAQKHKFVDCVENKYFFIIKYNINNIIDGNVLATLIFVSAIKLNAITIIIVYPRAEKAWINSTDIKSSKQNPNIVMLP